MDSVKVPNEIAAEFDLYYETHIIRENMQGDDYLHLLTKLRLVRKFSKEV